MLPRLSPDDVENFKGIDIDPKAVSGAEYVKLRHQRVVAYRTYFRAKFRARSSIRNFERQIISDTTAELYEGYEEYVQKCEEEWKEARREFMKFQAHLCRINARAHHTEHLDKNVGSEVLRDFGGAGDTIATGGHMMIPGGEHTAPVTAWTALTVPSMTGSTTAPKQESSRSNASAVCIDRAMRPPGEHNALLHTGSTTAPGETSLQTASAVYNKHNTENTVSATELYVRANHLACTALGERRATTVDSRTTGAASRTNTAAVCDTTKSDIRLSCSPVNRNENLQPVDWALHTSTLGTQWSVNEAMGLPRSGVGTRSQEAAVGINSATEQS